MNKCSTEADKRYWRPVGPSDCALLVAVPLTRDEFLLDVATATVADARATRGDYAFRMVSMRQDGDAEAAWRADGVPVAQLCLDLIKDARDCGIGYLAERADRAAFMQAAQSGASVILLVAHRRGAEVLTRDVRLAMRDHLPEIFANPTDTSVSLAKCMAAVDLGNVRGLRNGLNAFIKAKSDSDAARDVLDLLFAKNLVPGSCVELRDGYHKDAEIARWMPSDWKGVIELGVCHSIRLAKKLKGQRSDRHIITNEAQKEPSRCLREMREAVLRLAHRPQGYLPLRAQIFCEYSEMLRGKPSCC